MYSFLRRISILFVFVLAACGGGSNSPPIVTPSPSPPVAKTASWQVDDAIWEWWIKPTYLRDYSSTKDITYATFASHTGGTGLLVIDNNTGVVNRYILGTSALQFSPDDHNTGAIVVGGGRVAVILEGRDVLPPGDSSKMYYIEFAEGSDPTGLPFQPIEFGGNTTSNYPNAFNSNGLLFDISRVQTGVGDQWGYVLNTWPLTTFQPRKVFYHSDKYTWPYFAFARGTSDNSVFPFALAFHPVNSTLHNVYYGEVKRNGTTDPWDVVSNGKVIGNLTTGVGLPFNENSFEVVYEAKPGESVRVFNVSEDTVVFATFGADNIAMYQYATRQFGQWKVYPVISGGLPFNGLDTPANVATANGRNYYGGMSISHQDHSRITLARQDPSGNWFVEQYATNDMGKTWTLLKSIPYGTVVAARPMDELLSEESTGFNGTLGTAYWFGFYDPILYTNFLTTLTTFNQ